MSLLSLYSKIQLKIEKAEKRCHCEEERRSNPAATSKELNHGIAKACPERQPNGSAFLSLRSFSLLAMTMWFKLRLLFWKTAKIIVRFFALLFGDSSENYLIFTKVNKNSVIVCNNSFCQYKRFQKRVRFFSMTAFAGILICTIITSGILYFMMPGKDFIKAATYSWNQSDWITGADIAAVATHSLNQTGWQKFYSKDDNVNVGTAGEVKLTSTSSTIVDTDDADFNAGTQSTDLVASGDFYVNGGNLYLKKAGGGSCTVIEECASDVCASGTCLSSADLVTIGTQTWMKYNLNVGTKIAGASNQTNNATLEKYCYNDNEAYCDTDGGLYQWDEAMGYVTTAGAQGICPSGTHIPTDAEQHTLDDYLATGACDPARNNVWSCDPAGTALKVGGSSGFAGILVGQRMTDGTFLNRGSYVYLWSSMESGSSVWNRVLLSDYPTVLRSIFSKAFGFSVRCLKD